MGREEAFEFGPQGFGELSTDEIRDQVQEQPRIGAVPVEGRQAAGSMAGDQQTGGAPAELFEAPPTPPGELLDAVDRHQVAPAGVREPGPFLGGGPVLTAEA